jgi:hypothetical protein
MQMNSGEIVALIFLGTIAIVTVWRCLPGVIFSFFPEKFRAYYDNDERIIQKFLQKDNVLPIAEKLEALGFFKMGVNTAKLPLWGNKRREMMFASTHEHAFTSIIHVNYKTIYYFLTPFSGGQFVITAME